MKQQRAILIDIIPKEESIEKAKQDLKELSSLVNTYGGIVIVNIIQKRGRPSAKTFLGTGKAQEVADIAKEEKADMVIVNGILKPNQVQHLHTLFNIPIWDRVDLILKIFDKHAKTEEAKMQIELATLNHEFPKLYGLGTRFSRLGGGIATRGPGEKYLEVQKRHLRARIKDIENKLAGIRKIHKKQRKVRKRKGLKTIALVGYTNSGKSTLLKQLTNKEKVYIADELFATLDTKIGDLWLPNIQEQILVADTIGFIKDLPPFLIKAFMATLEEVQEADLLLHVIDCSASDMDEKVEVVNEILKDLGCKKTPLIYVFNKIDKNPSFKLPKRNAVKISAQNGLNLNKLIEMIEKAPIH